MNTIDCFGQPVVKTFPIVIRAERDGGPYLSSALFCSECTEDASLRSRGRLLFKGIMNETKQENSWPAPP